MAHLVDILPWTTFANNFVYKFPSAQFECSNIVPRVTAEAGEAIRQFAKTFHATMTACVDSQQSAKDAAYCDQPVMAIDETARRNMDISIKYIQHQSDKLWNGFPEYLYPATGKPDIDNYSLKAFIAEFHSAYYGNLPISYLEIVMKVHMFLLHDHLEPLFHLTRDLPVELNDDSPVYKKKPISWCWSSVFQYTLWSYLVLNILYTKPETWPSQFSEETDSVQDYDYRLTYLYQRVLHRCTSVNPYRDVCALPHRLFYGIPYDKALSSRTYVPRTDGRFTGCWSGAHIVTAKAIRQVMTALRIKGLPVELVTEILKLADFNVPECLLNVPGDPFHSENRSELKRYLAYCWQLMCNCALLARWCKQDIDLDSEIKAFVQQHFNGKAIKYYMSSWSDVGWVSDLRKDWTEI